MNPTPALSLAQALKLSASQCEKLNSLVPSVHNIAMAVIPVWGWGTFAAMSKTNSVRYLAQYPASTIYNECWPNVYTTLTMTWTNDNGDNGSLVCQAGYSDTGVTETLTGTPYPYQYSTAVSNVVDWSINADGTVLTVHFSDTDSQGVEHIGTFTATVSNPVAAWATLAAQASSLLALATIPTDGSITLIQPISTSPGYQISTRASGNFGVLACAYGMGGRWNTGANPGQTLGVTGDQACGLSIIDSPSFGGASSVLPNAGFIVCVKSTWQLLGSAPFNDPNTNNHLTLYAQEQSSSGALAATVINNIGTNFNGTEHPTPLIHPSTITFLDTDVAPNTGYTYGLIGFWPTRQ